MLRQYCFNRSSASIKKNCQVAGIQIKTAIETDANTERPSDAMYEETPATTANAAETTSMIKRTLLSFKLPISFLGAFLFENNALYIHLNAELVTVVQIKLPYDPSRNMYQVAGK